MTPHENTSDYDAELAVLGGIFLRPDLLGQLDLDSDDFADPRCRHVFGAMRNLEAAMRPIDPVTVFDAIDDGHDAAREAIGQAVTRVPTEFVVLDCAKIIRRHRVSREVMRHAADAIEAIRGGEATGNEVIPVLTERLMRIEGGDSRGAPMGKLVRNEFGAIEADAARKERGESVFVGVPTSLTKLDKLLGGIPVGLLTLVAGRPGHGKTTLAQTFCRAAADLTPDTPALFSYEDQDSGFAQREIARWTGVPTQAVRSREFERGHLRAIAGKAESMQRRREVIVQAQGMSVTDLCREVKRRRMRATSQGRSECGLVIVDYLQTMPLGGPRGTNLVQWLGDACKRLVELAATERIAVVAGSQLNRAVDSRENKRPLLSDLRDSGELEQLAKVVLGLYRPGKYDPKEDPSRLEIHVLKNHQGEADVFADVFWHLPTHTIVDAPVDLAGR